MDIIEMTRELARKLQQEDSYILLNTTQMDRLYFESSLAQALPDTPAPIITTSYMLFSPTNLHILFNCCITKLI